MTAAPVQRAAVGPDVSLTPREGEVLARVAAGETYEQIASSWVVAPVTVRGAGLRLMRKLGASTIANAVFVAVEVGLLEVGRRHGDHAGFAAHKYRGEEPCNECWAGERAYRRERHAARKAVLAGRAA